MTVKVEQKPFIDLVDKILTITKDLSACGHAQVGDDYLDNPEMLKRVQQAKIKEYQREKWGRYF